MLRKRDFSKGELTHYESLCVRKFLKEFTKIFVPLFVCRTENLRVEEEQQQVDPEGTLIHITDVLYTKHTSVGETKVSPERQRNAPTHGNRIHKHVK